VVEFIQGNDGYLSQHEWFQYVFDALTMFAVLANFNFVHPSEIKALLKGGKWSSGFKTHDIKSYHASMVTESPFETKNTATGLGQERVYLAES